MEAMNTQKNQKCADPPTAQHVHLLGCRTALWPALQVQSASLIFMLWSALTSLLNRDGSAPQLATTDNINQKHLGVPNSFRKPKMEHATIKSVKNLSRENGVTD